MPVAPSCHYDACASNNAIAVVPCCLELQSCLVASIGCPSTACIDRCLVGVGLDREVARQQGQLHKVMEEMGAGLDSLCGDLQRINAEFNEEPMTIIFDEPAVVVLSCCRMLGVCNGRTEFGATSSLSWAADGSIGSNAASN